MSTKPTGRHRGRPKTDYGVIDSGPFAGMARHSFACCLADPPWHHKQFSAKGMDRHPSRHYPTMPIAEIKALPVGDVAAKNAWLFLWTTWPHLPQALEVMSAWGFNYSSGFCTWVKLNPTKGSELFMTDKSFHYGTGYTTRKNTELLLLGRRGRPEILYKPRELLIAARREHSRKPDESFYRVEQFCPGPRLELFSRQPRDGWTTWGLETQKFVQPAPYEAIKLSAPGAEFTEAWVDELADGPLPQFRRRAQ